jgi:hypothetical protein
VPAWTLRFTPPPDDAETGAVQAACSRLGASVRWERPGFERRYALIESADDRVRNELARARATIFPGPVIALAVSPTVPEALPPLLAALGGAGRPAGVYSCERHAGAAIVEWDLERTPWETIEAAIDAECGVYRSGRVNDLLTPLPVAWWTALAAYGLHAPEIVPERVLEVQLALHDLDV